MLEVWSCGGGTQSAAIAALIVQGKLPKPAYAGIADTGREASETWRFYDDVLYPELKKVGVELHRIPHSLSTVDIYSGKDKNTIVMPMHTDKKGKPGMLPKYCSNEWKNRVFQRALRQAGLKAGHIWIGFSIDEMERMRAYDPRSKWNHTYPLVDLRLTRGDCISMVEKMGWGTPPRSACWMCPYRSDAEWVHLKNTDPADFRAAEKLENELQARDPNVFFHGSCKPLGEVNFGDGQEDLFAKPCASGMCFT
jgi:hypothetical protein